MLSLLQVLLSCLRLTGILRLEEKEGLCMEFASTMKQLRKERNLTQEGLAKRLGVSRQAVSNWVTKLLQ